MRASEGALVGVALCAAAAIVIGLARRGDEAHVKEHGTTREVPAHRTESPAESMRSAEDHGMAREATRAHEEAASLVVAMLGGVEDVGAVLEQEARNRRDKALRIRAIHQKNG